MSFQTTLIALDLAGVFVFAISGALGAARKGMDIVGMFVLGLVTATGGGALRSMLIGDLPVPFLRSPWPLAIAVIATLGAFFFSGLVDRFIMRPIRLFDAIGLGVFLAAGEAVALNLGQPWWAALFLGCVTAVVGGVLRDILRNELPFVFRPSELYATAALIGGLAQLAGEHLGTGRGWAMLIGATITIVVRLFAIYFKWETKPLPPESDAPTSAA